MLSHVNLWVCVRGTTHPSVFWEATVADHHSDYYSLLELKKTLPEDIQRVAPTDEPNGDPHTFDRAVAFFEKPTDSLSAKRARCKALTPPTTLQATADWLKLLDTYLFMFKGKGLDFCKNLGKLDEVGGVKAAKFGIVGPGVLAAVAKMSAPESLDIAVNEEQVQIAGRSAGNKCLV